MLRLEIAFFLLILTQSIRHAVKKTTAYRLKVDTFCRGLLRFNFVCLKQASIKEEAHQKPSNAKMMDGVCGGGRKKQFKWRKPPTNKQMSSFPLEGGCGCPEIPVPIRGSEGRGC